MYFQPININQAKYSEASPNTPDVESCSKELREILLRSRRSNYSAMNERGAESVGVNRDGNDSICPSRLSKVSQSMLSQGKVSGQRQMVILDKEKVLTQHNDLYKEEDMMWLMGQESTGSLCLLSNQASDEGKGRHTNCSKSLRSDSAPKKKNPNKDRIVKGSVAHKVYSAKNRSLPLMSVCGDKYTQTPLPSPIMRSQTQYSQSSTRMSMHSPDPYNIYSSSNDRLPPLEYLRANLWKMEHPEEARALAVQTNLLQKREEAQAILKKTPYVRLSADLRKAMSQTGTAAKHRIK